MTAKKKLHLNLVQFEKTENNYWVIKKAFGFLPEKDRFTQKELEAYLQVHEDVDVVLRYL